MPTFNGEAFKKAVIDAVMEGIRAAAEKAMESAVEDAPVRAVFFKGQTRRRRGLRRRALTLEEANSEDYIRRRLAGRSGRPLQLASPSANFTAGRRFSPDPYLRLASTRKGNPNSFSPFVLREAVRAKAPSGRTETLVEAIRGGRAVATTPSGGRYLTAKKARDALDARGRYELRTGRALSVKKGEPTTLGGTLRRSIFIQGPHMIGSIIKARVVSPVYYSQYQEFGTRHNRATPYMRPAIAKMHNTFRRDMVKAINGQSARWRGLR